MKGGYAGTEYEGYLVVISSKAGDIVYVETSLSTWIEDPQVIENLRELYMAGAADWISRLFDKEGKKIPPPRKPEG